jgi:hypothetical protein
MFAHKVTDESLIDIVLSYITRRNMNDQTAKPKTSEPTKHDDAVTFITLAVALTLVFVGVFATVTMQVVMLHEWPKWGMWVFMALPGFGATACTYAGVSAALEHLKPTTKIDD